MTITTQPWPHPWPEQAQGETADDATCFLVTPYLAGEECIGLWRMRSKQIVDTPSDAPWVTCLAVASASPNVNIVRATISPENHASRSLVDGYGFKEVGEQRDEEDGLEIILEMATGDIR